MRSALSPAARELRLQRIFARLQDGASYADIAAEEGFSRERLRQIIRAATAPGLGYDGPDHKRMQIARLTPADVAAEPSEIVVIAEKLKDWRGTWGEKNGVLACRTTRSTGDAEVDAVGCQALIACASPLLPQFRSIAAAKMAKAERQRRMNTASQSMIPCLESQRQAGTAALADRQAGA